MPSARRERLTSLARAAFALLAAAGLACAGGSYEAYREAHPGWAPDYPRERISVAELYASLHAPSVGRSTLLQVTQSRVLALGTTPWQVVPERELADGVFAADPGRLYVVAARMECHWSRRGLVQREGALVWYVLRDDHMLAYRHAEFEEYCHVERTVRGSVHAIEGFEEKLEALMSVSAGARADSPAGSARR